ncbi:hypothetical protein DPMN_017162 [Dreissena polymorpha]|uniref:Uncharacterized protein n=1 Tax=Dreissena polymorpha TaxID=45954 RepID=A0A9D4S765_DREPO|nr:hypothetical protein DPMN_017162 [Dreissena polymorpha]
MKGPQTDPQDLNNNPSIETDLGNGNEGKITVEDDIYKVKDIMQTVLNEKQIPDALSNNSTIQDFIWKDMKMLRQTSHNSKLLDFGCSIWRW